MYRLTDTQDAVIRIADGALIPIGHRFWIDYQAWLAAGNTPEPAQPIPSPYPALIAARRYQAETAGVTVNGMRVDTDDRSKLLINGAAVEAMLDPAYVLRWKTPSGFVDLTAQYVIGVARAVRAHVQACFDREAELLAALDAGTFTDSMLDEGWPNG
ncbi:hypothetical protein D9M70_496090 [compost metagenome]